MMRDTITMGARMKARMNLAAMVVGASLVALASPSAAGSWKYAETKSGNPELKYIENGKATFYIGCGRAFGLHVKYPGKPGEEEKPAAITISNGKDSMSFKGEFEKPFEDMATTFRQWDLGFERQDPDLYGEKWKAVRDQLLNLLDAGQPLTISADKDSYKLPPNPARKWRASFDDCG